MSDRVFVRNLGLHGSHGVFPEERRIGQKFFIDIDCVTDIRIPARSDSYRDAVCYATLCDLAAEVSASGPFKLIETLGERIAARILEAFPSVTEVRVEVRKPSAPVQAMVDHVGIAVTRRRRARIGLSLGSNLGDKAATIRMALALLQAEEAIEIDGISALYRTPPWGKTDQDWFVNACAVGWSSAEPLALLKAFKRIELQLGRVPAERWGPRVIDIDLLFMDDRVVATPQLTLPHPEMFNRAFVLVPLAELVPDHRVQGQVIGEAAAALGAEAAEVTRLEA